MNSIDSITLEVADTAAAERFYNAAFGLGDLLRLRASDAATTGFRGFTLYFAMPSSPIGLGLYKRRALAKAAGVAPEGSGSRRLIINSAESFTDPDGFEWAPASVSRAAKHTGASVVE